MYGIDEEFTGLSVPDAIDQMTVVDCVRWAREDSLERFWHSFTEDLYADTPEGFEDHTASGGGIRWLGK